ncbi:glycerophosphodiester phosphodiesterase [Planococcus ruber]|uniref:glycerophosphodiester phosphodiesterase n=1 Tax=Planococcus ruber TaxID=2027871 RepID=UPI001FEEA3AB|nr:hypothetical protein [Planococcus ruber]
MSEVKVYAHRGASGYMLENTWSAFQKACEFGVGIELDVQITKDGVVVVYHDDNLKRLSGKNCLIEANNYESLKDIKIGKRWKRRFISHSIPLAYEVFRWAKEKDVPLNIEMKKSVSTHPEGPEILAAMLEGAGEFHLSSFDPQLLRKMKKRMPETEMALIVKKGMPLEKIEKMEWIDSIHLHKRLYSMEFLKNLHQMKKKIRIYGLLGREAALRELAPELAGVITDYPDRIKEKLRLAYER